MVALVTGASSGIGRDIAIELAKRKYDIIAIARNEEALIKLKEEVEKTYNVNVEVRAMDLTDREGCIKLHEDVKAKYGAIDVLINDAGFGTCGEFTKSDLNKEEYDEDVGDTNIDFRRVRNIKVYLDRNALKLANDSDFNPGDIVVYKKHIAIVSDKLNKDGQNYILHQHMYQTYEYDGLFKNKILGHYRWRLNDGKE